MLHQVRRRSGRCATTRYGGCARARRHFAESWASPIRTSITGLDGGRAGKVIALLGRTKALLFVGFDPMGDELAEVVRLLRPNIKRRKQAACWVVSRSPRARAKASSLGLSPLWLEEGREAEVRFVQGLAHAIQRWKDEPKASIWPPPEGTKAATVAALRAGHVAIAEKDFATAAEKGAEVVGGADGEAQIVLEGLGLIYNALRAFVAEAPPTEKPVPIERRAEMLHILEQGLLQLTKAPQPWRQHAGQLQRSLRT